MNMILKLDVLICELLGIVRRVNEFKHRREGSEHWEQIAFIE
jgi:hypothetical protein